MIETKPVQPEPKTVAEYKAALDALISEMLQTEERMDKNRIEIERFRAQSEVINRHTDAVLEEIREQLKALRKAA